MIPSTLTLANTSPIRSRCGSQKRSYTDSIGATGSVSNILTSSAVLGMDESASGSNTTAFQFGLGDNIRSGSHITASRRCSNGRLIGETPNQMLRCGPPTTSNVKSASRRWAMFRARSSRSASPQPRRRGQSGSDADSVRTHAGMGDQPATQTCKNDSEGCPGPDAPTGILPCLDCMFGEGPCGE